MNDFEGLLASDFGFKPSGKSAPLSASASASTKGSANLNPNFDLGSLGQSRSARTSNSYNGSLSDDRDSFFGLPGSQKSQDFSGLGDIVGGSMRYSSKSETRGADTAFNFDSMFGTGAKSSTNSDPVFDKPVYDDDDDDIFDGVPGLKSSSSKVKHDDDDFSSVSSLSGKESSAFDDLLGGFGKAEFQSKSFGAKGSEKNEKVVPAFDDLLPGFGGSSISSQRSDSGANFASENTIKVNKSKSNVIDDPFVVTGDFNDPLEEISKLSNSGSMKKDSSVDNGSVYDDMDPFGDLGKSIPAFSSERNNRGKERNTEKTDSSTSGTKTFYSSKEPMEKPSVRSPDSQLQKKVHIDNDWDSRQTMFDMSTASTDSHKHTSQNMSPPSYASASFRDENVQGDRSIRYEEKLDSSEYVWLTVSDIPLFTQPTTAPPPSRPPPPRPVLVSKAGSSSPASTNARRKPNDFSSFPNSSQNSHIPRSDPASASTIDDLEDFVTGRSRDNVDEHGNVLASEGLEMNSAAAAMKEAMDRAETKFRHAKEVREREVAEAARSRETQVEKDDKEERWDREQLYREREEEEMEQRKLEREREWEEKQRELRKLENGRERARQIEKERERARQIEKEREKARQAVERATREARERAAAEARLRADRAKAEKAAVERANAEARERAERAAVQRAQAEARERAAAEARGRAEKAASDRANAEAKEREARERAAAAKPEAEARARAEQRAAVERAAAEARKRTAAESRERAAAAARASQQKSENDLEAFFGMGRASSAPRPRANSSVRDPMTKQQAETPKASSVSSSNTRKASSTANIVDDLSSIFGAAPSSGDQDFQEVEGESEERRRARLERHQRTHERAARALAEKNERDLQNQREQAERSRIGETLDAEVRRWASGKEGNLRALLSTLQYVLWPECGWQPVSLTDMIIAASVKKVYRKATLCIHPDKVQQKGANLQQKYVAEKVFDLLKEAWNKFNSEELF